MKKGILAVCLLALLLAGTAAAEGAKLTVAVATDMHYLSPTLNDNGERFMNNVYASDGKVIHYSPQICKAFVRDMLRLKPNAVILSGDLSLNGARVSLQEFADLLAPLSEAGIRVLVMPGNHDIGGMAYSFSQKGIVGFSAASAADFLRIYKDYGYAEALSRDENSLSYIAGLSDRVWALMLDVNSNSTAQGTVREATFDWLEAQLRAAQEAGVTVIGVSHQNLLAHHRYLSQGVMISQAQELLRLYRQYGVRLNLSGHTHLQHAASEGGLVEIVTASMALSPGYYGVITINGGEPATYEAVPVDVAGWAQENGETNADLLDFARYSEAFYREVMRRKAAAMVESLPEEDREEMVRFAVELSYRDFSGTRAELTDEGGLALWEKYLPNAIYTWYLKGVLTEEPRDMNRYIFSGTAE